MNTLSAVIGHSFLFLFDFLYSINCDGQLTPGQFGFGYNLIRWQSGSTPSTAHRWLSVGEETCFVAKRTLKLRA